MTMVIASSAPSSASLFSPWWSIRPVQNSAMAGSSYPDTPAPRKPDQGSHTHVTDSGARTYFDPDGMTGNLLNIYV